MVPRVHSRPDRLSEQNGLRGADAQALYAHVDDVRLKWDRLERVAACHSRVNRLRIARQSCTLGGTCIAVRAAALVTDGMGKSGSSRRKKGLT
jgi:hypothetical protein